MQMLTAYGYVAYQQLSKTMARVGNAGERGGAAKVVVPARRASARGDRESAGPPSTDTALVQKLVRTVTPPTTQPSMTMTRAGNGTACSCTAVLRRQQHG